MLNIAVVAPMPTAIVRTAAAPNPSDRRSSRAPYLTSVTRSLRLDIYVSSRDCRNGHYEPRAAGEEAGDSDVQAGGVRLLRAVGAPHARGRLYRHRVGGAGPAGDQTAARRSRADGVVPHEPRRRLRRRRARAGGRGRQTPRRETARERD